MSTSFNRHRAQLRCESFLSCTSPEEWATANFREFQLNASQSALLQSDLLSDSRDLYFKGILSLFESIKSINLGLYSWATIKIYYSIYYFLRCTMALNGIALVRQRSLFYLKSLTGETPVTKGNKKYNSDHSGTISYFVDLFSSDILLSQPIETLNSYEWLMNRREQVNYRERAFNEPEYSEFWHFIANQNQSGRFENLINDYWNDRYLLCFQEEHAMMAIPIKRAMLTNIKLYSEKIDIGFSKAQRNLLISLLPSKENKLVKLLETNVDLNS
jgi:hypothetical protein